MADTRALNEQLREYALGFPGAEEAFPWDERVIKVNKKIFVFFGLPAEMDGRLFVGVKLPQTGVYALQMPGVQASGYNLGKHGWVNVRYSPADEPPLDLLKEWIEESYRAVAPKRLIAQLDAQRVGSRRDRTTEDTETAIKSPE